METVRKLGKNKPNLIVKEQNAVITISILWRFASCVLISHSQKLFIPNRIYIQQVETGDLRIYESICRNYLQMTNNTKL